MEKDTPSGCGLATEMGYARGLGKTIILVDDKPGVDGQFKGHFAMPIFRAKIDRIRGG